MIKSFLLILVVALMSCSHKINCIAEREYRNHLYLVNRELSDPIQADSSFHKELAFARTFVKDSLNSRIECFQYNHNVWDSTTYAIELYDKSQVIKEYGEMGDSSYYRLNHIVDLIFDENRNYVDRFWVADTKKEQRESRKMMKRLLKD